MSGSTAGQQQHSWAAAAALPACTACPGGLGQGGSKREGPKVISQYADSMAFARGAATAREAACLLVGRPVQGRAAVAAEAAAAAALSYLAGGWVNSERVALADPAFRLGC